MMISRHESALTQSHGRVRDYHLRKDRSRSVRSLNDTRVRESALTESEDRWWCCTNCATRITQSRFQIPINDCTEHRFANPAGMTFHIACFTVVFSVTMRGHATLKDTWFPGYLWRILLCRACELQLGWEFAGPDTFYGLIINRLQLRAL